VLEHARATCADDGDIDVTVEPEAGHARLRVRFPAIKPAPDIATQFDTFRAPVGLGLMALRTARQIVELQQGSLDAREDAGSGIRELVVELTRGTEPEQGEAATANAAIAAPRNGKAAHLPMTILLVDDNVALRTTYSEALTELGYDVIAAADGDEAIEVATARKPDVALIDIHLPTVNGYQVARAL
jgi:CheY-like chemotaxis protein